MCWDHGSCNHESSRRGKETHSGLVFQQICCCFRQAGLTVALPPAVFYKKADVMTAFCLNCQAQTPIQALCLPIVQESLPGWSLPGGQSSLCGSLTCLNMRYICSAMLKLGSSTRVPEKYLLNFESENPPGISLWNQRPSGEDSSWTEVSEVIWCLGRKLGHSILL